MDLQTMIVDICRTGANAAVKVAPMVRQAARTNGTVWVSPIAGAVTLEYLDAEGQQVTRSDFTAAERASIIQQARELGVEIRSAF